MSSRLNNLPDWAQLVIAAAVLLVSMALAYGDLRADLQVEITTREQVDIRIERSVEEIKSMLKEELQRHHGPHR